MPAKLHAPANAPVLAALLRIQSRPGSWIAVVAHVALTCLLMHTQLLVLAPFQMSV